MLSLKEHCDKFGFGLPKDFKRINVENLEKLSVYLKGPLKAEFDMSRFDDGSSPHHCGTAGCALGHSPFALGILKEPSEGWIEYADRVYGTGVGCSLSYVWGYLFSSYWAYKEPTALQAAERIDRVLAEIRK